VAGLHGRHSDHRRRRYRSVDPQGFELRFQRFKHEHPP